MGIQIIRRLFFYDNIVNKPFKRVIEKLGLSSKVYDFLDRFELHVDSFKMQIKRLVNKENPVIVEIGANTGTDTVVFLQVFKNKVQMHCIEPSPLAINEFKERLNQYKKNHKDVNCKLYEIAISNKNKFSTFYLDEHDPRCGNGSLKKLTPGGLNTTNYAGFKNNFNKQIEVKTMTLDNWAKENKIDIIDFIWSDVEGSEKELIEGGLETLNKKTRFFFFEFVPNRSIWEGQVRTLKEILDLLPNFEVFRILYTEIPFKYQNVILKNTKLN